MNKNFKNYLETLNENTLVYVGTDKGSSWIVIETVRTIMDNLERLENIVRERVVKQYQTASDHIVKIPYQIVDLRKKIEEEDNDRNKRKMKSRLLELETKFNNAFIMRKNSSEQLDKWIQIDKRTVVEHYEQEGEESGICVILEGSDNGTIWYRGEKKVL